MTVASRDVAGEIEEYLRLHGDATADDIRKALHVRKGLVLTWLQTDERFSGPYRAPGGGRSQFYLLTDGNGQEQPGTVATAVEEAPAEPSGPLTDLEQQERWALDTLAILAEPQPIYIRKEAPVHFEVVHESGVARRVEVDPELDTLTIVRRKRHSQETVFGRQEELVSAGDVTLSLGDLARLELVREQLPDNPFNDPPKEQQHAAHIDAK
jgi:hypothetical protein